MDYLAVIAEGDVAHLREKERTYQGSWKQRGGVGAFMMLARKWDRIENQVTLQDMAFDPDGGGHSVKIADKYDIFHHVQASAAKDGLLDDLRDLRRYLLLVEAELTATGAVARLEGAEDAAD